MEINQVVAQTMYRARENFLNRNRDLVASIVGGANNLLERMQADMPLDEDFEPAINNKCAELTSDENDFVGNALTHQNRAVRSVAQGLLEIELYKQICLSFLRLGARGAITYAITLTPEAADQEFQVEVDSGCRLPQAAIERQAQAQAAAESLDAEITADWNGRIRTDQITAKKKANPQYGARLDQLLNEGRLS